MARRNMFNYLIHRDKITEPLKLIDNSNTDYITPSGRVYKDYGNNMFFPKKNYENKVNHYIYCGITENDGLNHQRRIHILVAKAFMPNPHNYDVVGHKDNDKTNCNVNNLYWTTTQENTQKAYDDGLAKNAKSWDDSQSIAVCVFDLSGMLIRQYGSVSECSRALNITKSGILYQCNHKVKSKPRCGYYFRYQSEYIAQGFVL